jgi:hypothetical protein
VAGWAEGSADGWLDGREEGWLEGSHVGTADGCSDGCTVGWLDGEDGLILGWLVGFEGSEEGWTDGWPVGGSGYITYTALDHWSPHHSPFASCAHPRLLTETTPGCRSVAAPYRVRRSHSMAVVASIELSIA